MRHAFCAQVIRHLLVSKCHHLKPYTNKELESHRCESSHFLPSTSTVFMDFEQTGHCSIRVNSGSTVNLGKIYPNDIILSKQRQSSPTPEQPSQGSLLVNVSQTGRNVCKASKEDPKTCGGKNAYLNILKPTHDVEGKKIRKRELRVGLGGCKHGGRCVVIDSPPVDKELTQT